MNKKQEKKENYLTFLWKTYLFPSVVGGVLMWWFYNTIMYLTSDVLKYSPIFTFKFIGTTFAIGFILVLFSLYIKLIVYRK